MCIFSAGFGYPFGFRVSVRVSGIRGFGFGDGFPPESVFGSGLGFDFGFRFWVHGDSTRSEPDPLPSSKQMQTQKQRGAANGISVTLMSFFKAVAPAGAEIL
jgi:hypothetical protein